MARFDTIIITTSNVFDQVISSQKIFLNDVLKATLDTTLSGQIGLTVDQFNALSNVANQRGQKIGSLFNDSSKVSSVLFSKESYYEYLTGSHAGEKVKPNASDAATFTVPTRDPAVYGAEIRIVLIEVTALTYGWYCSRISVGTSNTAYGPAERRYQDIFLHDADFDLSRVPGTVGFWSGIANHTNQSNAAEKNTALFFGQGNNPATSTILEYPRCYSSGTNKMTIGTNTASGVSESSNEAIKTFAFVILNNNLSYYGFDFFPLQSGGGSELIVVRRNGSSKIVVSSNGSLFPSVTCDGTSGNPNIPAAPILYVLLTISATAVILTINGISLTIKKTGGANLTETDINGAITTNTRQSFAENGDFNAGTIDNYFAYMWLNNSNPDAETQAKIDNLMKKVALLV